MRRSVLAGGVAGLAAVLGMAAIAAVSHGGVAMEPNVLCSPGKVSACATLIIHEYFRPVIPGENVARRPEEHGCLRVRNDQTLSSKTTRAHKLRVAPGRYEIAAVSGGPLLCESPTYVKKTVTVSKGQTRDVTLEVRGK